MQKRIYSFLSGSLSDGASVQIQKDGVAQAAVQTETACSGSLLQDDPTVQPAQVRVPLNDKACVRSADA